MGNLSFKYIHTTGIRERLQYNHSTENISEGLNDSDGNSTSTAEKEDDTAAFSTQENVTSGIRFDSSRDAASTAEKEVQDDSDTNAQKLYISGNVVTPENKQDHDSDGTAETIVIAGKKVTPDVGGTVENNEQLPDYYFDFLNNISLPDRSSAYDDSRNISMTFAFTSNEHKDIHVLKMSESKDTESEPSNVIKRKKPKFEQNDYSEVKKINLRGLKEKYYIVKDGKPSAATTSSAKEKHKSPCTTGTEKQANKVGKLLVQ